MRTDLPAQIAALVTRVINRVSDDVRLSSGDAGLDAKVFHSKPLGFFEDVRTEVIALLITAECEKSFPFMPFELGYEVVPGLAYGCPVRQATENEAQSMKREMLRKCCGWQ